MLSSHSRQKRSRINTDVANNLSNNHGVNTTTNEKINVAHKQTNSYKNNDKITTIRDKDDSNLIKRQSENRSTVRKEVFIIDDLMIIHGNGREVSRNNSEKMRSHSGAKTNGFIDMSNQPFAKSNYSYWCK